MSAMLDLKQIERKAYLATYQDGLWDLYTGGVVAAMSIFMHRPEGGYSAFNAILAVLIVAAAYSLYRAGKKFITLPRLGQAQFGPLRQRKKRTLAIILGIAVLAQAGLVVLTAVGLFNPSLGLNRYGFIGDLDTELLVVASIGALMVGVSMLISAFFNDFVRGYYLAAMMALGVFTMILLNQPVVPLAISALMIVPGLALLVRFLKQHPLPKSEESHE